MARNTSILLGDYFDKFIDKQIHSGKYSSVSEVIRAALRVFEQEEMKNQAIISELERGEKSEKIRNFDRDDFLSDIHEKYVIK